MRYIITYVAAKNEMATLTTTRAVIADCEENARRAFRSRQDNEIVSVQPADESMRTRVGLGWYTDEEEDAIKRGLQERYNQMEIKRQKALEDVSAMEPDEFAAYVAHVEARNAQPTQNAEGLHVGDILEYCYGYDMTCWGFYQVVGLCGSHTVIVRENMNKFAEFDSGMGYQRPIRDQFASDETKSVRTRMASWPNGTQFVRMKAPGGDHNMKLISGIGIHGCNLND